jgi:hypothetical protein
MIAGRGKKLRLIILLQVTFDRIEVYASAASKVVTT